jgi:phospholipase C
MTRGFRLAIGASAVAVLAAEPVAASALSGSSGPAQPRPANSQPGGPSWTAHDSAARRRMGPYLAYVALAGGYMVARVDVASHTVLPGSIGTDTAEGVAVTPDGRTVYVANTGQYQLLAVDAATLRRTAITVGAYPGDVAVSPDGSQVYVTDTGGDTGPGGSQAVAVVSTATNAVTARIDVGAAPRRVVFAPDGKHAYVSTARGVAVIDTATLRATRVPGITTAQGLAVNGTTLYATEPDADRVWIVDTSRPRATGSFAAGEEPWAVTVTPDGRRVYVADMNSDSAGVYDAASHRRLADVAVGRLPSMIAAIPDGSEVWVGNDMSGTISVIDTATDRLTTTIVGGRPNRTLDSAPLGIAFAKNS